MTKIYKGEDRTFPIKLMQDGIPIEFDAFAELRFNLYNRNYAKQAGYTLTSDQVTIINADEATIMIHVPGSVIPDQGKLLLRIEADVQDNNFPGSLKTRKSEYFVLGEVQP